MFGRGSVEGVAAPGPNPDLTIADLDRCIIQSVQARSIDMSFG